ncbi:ABC transporter permease [Lentibacillus sediminis]|uniref:ABC transporter permease n=1 Tax=Lentibacillus sediminis TaxID=1940529 RepID=UPI000C1C6224|nr:ABC transporter permease [Lentibacillus sediminis]
MDYIKWELKVFFTNHKNLILFAILLVASVYYAFYIAPAYQPIESVNQNEIESRYEDRQEFLDNVEVTPGTHPLTLYSYQVYPEWNELDGERLSALEDGDLRAYAQATHEWYLYADYQIDTNRFEFLRYSPGYYTYGNMFSHQDGHYAYLYSAERYGEYASAVYNLNLNIFEERTALQTLQRLLESSLPYILLLSCLLLSNDIVMKDRKHPSIVNGFPMTPFKRMIMKGIVALIGSLASIAILLPAFFVIGFRDGFGTLNLPVVVYQFAFLNEGTFESMPMGMFLMISFVMVLIWFVLIIGLVLLMSIILKNEYFNLMIGIILFVEITYYQRGEIIENWLSYFPTSYVQFADIISGYRNYALLTGSLEYEKGLVVLLLTVILIILLIWLVTKKKRMTI